MTKIARPGSEGNIRLLKEYGGGSTAPRQHYATGGAVRSGDNPALDEGMSASGEASRPNLARAGRKMKSKDKKEAKTSINIVVMGKDKDAAPPVPGPMAAAGPMAPPAMPMPMKPPMGPPMASPDGPPMPMRASGGRVNRMNGGSATTKQEPTTPEPAPTSNPDREPPMYSAEKKMHPRLNIETYPLSPDWLKWDERRRGGTGPTRKAGGRVEKHDKYKHPDVPMTKLSVGGPAKPPVGIDDGAGGGKGRLEKVKAYGK